MIRVPTIYRAERLTTVIDSATIKILKIKALNT